MSEQTFHDRFYDRDSERIFSSPLYRQLLNIHAAFLLGVTPRADSAAVLSIGCGDGRREIDLARHFGRLVGIDVSPVAVEKARQRAAALAVSNVEFLVGDGTHAPDCGGPFDAIWCPGVLHHLSDGEIAELLRSARAALAPGGRFVSMDPNAGRAVNVFKPLFRRQYERFHSRGERELRPGAVVDMLERAGWQPIAVRFIDAFVSPLAWLYPQVPTGPARFLARLDQLLVRVPIVNSLSSGFAVVAGVAR